MPHLYQIAVSILGNSQDAEDAVQEVYLRVWEQADRVEEMKNPEGYFMKTLRNVCINMLRERHSNDDLEIAAAVPEENETEERQEQRSFCVKVMQALNPKWQRVIRLRHVGEYSMSDISQITGESEANVRTILSRARRQLREEYQKVLK